MVALSNVLLVDRFPSMELPPAVFVGLAKFSADTPLHPPKLGAKSKFDGGPGDVELSTFT
jgi:hypothetical protein